MNLIRQFAQNSVQGKFFALVFVMLICVSCGKKGGRKAEEAVEKNCVIPSEQANSLQGKWTALPIKVTLKAGDWSGEESAAIVKGGDTWNKFFNLSKGFSIFQLDGSTSNLVQNLPSCGSSTLADGTVIYKRPSGWTKSPTAIAVTTTCFNVNTNGTLPTISNAMMEVNFVNFFVANSGRFPDLESIALHELGHLLGLDHACGALGRPNQNLPNVDCPDANADPDNELVKAVMFPQVFFESSGNGEQKRKLEKNDQGRANCIYE